MTHDVIVLLSALGVVGQVVSSEDTFDAARLAAAIRGLAGNR